MSVKPVDFLLTISHPPPVDKQVEFKEWLNNTIAQLNDVLFDHGYAINQLAVGNLPYVQLKKPTAAPVTPEPGWVAYADGVAWDPGGGEGFYGYKADATWHKII